MRTLLCLWISFHNILVALFFHSFLFSWLFFSCPHFIDSIYSIGYLLPAPVSIYFYRLFFIYIPFFGLFFFQFMKSCEFLVTTGIAQDKTCRYFIIVSVDMKTTSTKMRLLWNFIEMFDSFLNFNRLPIIFKEPIQINGNISSIASV